MDQDKQTLLEAAKAFGEAWFIKSMSSHEAVNLRAAIAREEARQVDNSLLHPLQWWIEEGRKRLDRAQQAEADAKWHREESARLSADLAKERKASSCLHAEICDDALRIRQRAEKAEAELAKEQERADRAEKRYGQLRSAIDRDRPVKEMRERAEKAEAELAKVRSFLAQAQGISETLSAEDAVNAAQGVINRDAGQFARLGYPTPMNVGKVLPLVVDELLRLRAEVAKPQQSHPMDGGEITVMLNRAGVKATKYGPDGAVDMTTEERVACLIDELEASKKWLKRANEDRYSWEKIANKAEAALAKLIDMKVNPVVFAPEPSKVEMQTHAFGSNVVGGKPTRDDADEDHVDPMTGWTFATYRRVVEALGGKS